MSTLLFAAAVGNGSVSADFTLDADTLVAVTGATQAVGQWMLIQLKLSTGAYRTIATLNGQNPSGVLPAGTYRAKRIGAQATGLEKA